MGLSRDDYTKFSKDYEDKKIFKADPFGVLDQEGVGMLVKMGRREGPRRPIRISKSASAASTAASRARSSSATASAWTTCRCSPYRVPIARLAAAQAAISDKSEANRTA